MLAAVMSSDGKDAMEPGFAASEIDTSKPHPARMYDAYLGGHDNYPADRAAVRQVLRNFPEVRPIALANREFLQRAVRFLAAEAAIRQFIDIGTGIPSAGNVHEVAGRAAPGARVVYVDNDPIVHVHANALLTASGTTGIVLAGLRDPAAIVAHPQLRELIDFTRPVALLLVAILHFIRDEEDPAGIVAPVPACTGSRPGARDQGRLRAGRAGPSASPRLAARATRAALLPFPRGPAPASAAAGRAGAGLDAAGGAERPSWQAHGRAAAGNAHRSRPALRHPGRRTRKPGRPAADDRGGDRRAADLPGRVLPLAPAGHRAAGGTAARRRGAGPT